MVHNKTSVHFRHFAEHIFARLIKKYHFKLGKLVQECKVLYPMISTDFPQLVCVKSWKIVERFISQLSVKKCRICLPTAKILADFKHDQLTSSSPLLTVVEIVKNRPKWSKSSLNGSHDTREHKVRRSDHMRSGLSIESNTDVFALLWSMGVNVVRLWSLIGQKVFFDRLELEWTFFRKLSTIPHFSSSSLKVTDPASAPPPTPPYRNGQFRVLSPFRKKPGIFPIPFSLHSKRFLARFV